MGWEVDEVVPITCLFSNLWELLLRLLLMPCYASRRGLGECIHDRCGIVKLMVYLISERSSVQANVRRFSFSQIKSAIFLIAIPDLIFVLV